MTSAVMVIVTSTELAVTLDKCLHLAELHSDLETFSSGCRNGCATNSTGGLAVLLINPSGLKIQSPQEYLEVDPGPPSGLKMFILFVVLCSMNYI